MTDDKTVNIDATLDETDASVAALGYTHAKTTTLPVGMPRDRETLTTRQQASPKTILTETPDGLTLVASVRRRWGSEKSAIRRELRTMKRLEARNG